jgi:hypothetical protein
MRPVPCGGGNPLCPSDISPKYDNDNLGCGVSGWIVGFGGDLAMRAVHAGEGECAERESAGDETCPMRGRGSAGGETCPCGGGRAWGGSEGDLTCLTRAVIS